jgi:hypothetical protein
MAKVENIDNAAWIDTPSAIADEVRQTELRRMKSLVDRDMQVAREIIADDFELIPPSGIVLTKHQYLGDVETGFIRYFVWETASPITVRVYSDLALIRYLAKIDLEAAANRTSGLHWFTDAYEKREGRWQIVWSQGTPAAT